MHGLETIMQMNARAKAIHVEVYASEELAEAKTVHKRLLVCQKAYSTNTELSQLISQAADLIDSAYGVSE